MHHEFIHEVSQVTVIPTSQDNDVRFSQGITSLLSDLQTVIPSQHASAHPPEVARNAHVLKQRCN